MGPRLGNWAIVLGVIVSFAGLCIVASAVGKTSDPGLMAFGACLFSIGAVIIAGGIYIKARTMKVSTATNSLQTPLITPKKRGGCDLCGPETPVILCKIHQLHLCGNCLAQHYDLRSCIYIPTPRKAVNKPARPVQSKARGA
jgi:hypothetical protein